MGSQTKMNQYAKLARPHPAKMVPKKRLEKPSLFCNDHEMQNKEKLILVMIWLRNNLNIYVSGLRVGSSNDCSSAEQKVLQLKIFGRARFKFIKE